MAFAPASPIPLPPRTIQVTTPLIFKASATASAPHHLSLPSERGSASTEEVEVDTNGGSLDVCVAQTAAEKVGAVKVEPSGSAVSLQLLGELLRCHGARSQRSQIGGGGFLRKRDFSCDFWWRSCCFRMEKWSWVELKSDEICNYWINQLWVQKQQYHDKNKNHFKSSQSTLRFLNIWIWMVAIDTTACMFPYPSSIVDCLSWIRTFPGNKSAKSSGWSCCSSAFVASNRQKKHKWGSAT